MKYLILKFKNAKLPLTSNSDVVIINPKIGKDGYSNRIDDKQFVNPIVYSQLSNMLHVFLGERPAPIKRYTFYNRLKHIDEMAKNSYLKIDTLKFKYEINGITSDYPIEFFKLNKAKHDSWRTDSSFINWEILNRFLGVKKEDFYLELKKIYPQNPFKISFLKFYNEEFDKIDKNTKKYAHFKERMNTLKLGTLLSTLEKKGKLSDIKVIHNLNGIGYFNILSGTILVPIEDQYISKLRNCATILDGGRVTIYDIVSENELSIEGFTKVGDISLITKKFKK